jgi:hypothetical protein
MANEIAAAKLAYLMRSARELRLTGVDLKEDAALPLVGQAPL